MPAKPKTIEQARKACTNCRNFAHGNYCIFMEAIITVENRHSCFLGGWADWRTKQAWHQGKIAKHNPCP